MLSRREGNIRKKKSTLSGIVTAASVSRSSPDQYIYLSEGPQASSTAKMFSKQLSQVGKYTDNTDESYGAMPAKKVNGR